MQATTIQKYLHTSPRKLRLVADSIRKMTPAKALTVLNFVPKDAALDLSKAIKTVLANAKTLGMDTEKVGFEKIEINESLKMKRFRAGTRGRVKPFKRRMSNIKIVLSDDLKIKAQMANVKTKKIKTEKKVIEASKVEEVVVKEEIK